MPRTRVLIVDDSVVVRRLLSDIISADPDLEVAGVAASGTIAMAKIPHLNPDVVTLDVEMPGLSGLETLDAIRRLYPAIRILMFSSGSEHAASTTLDALARGATDYVTKPTMAGSREAAIEQMRSQLLPRLRGLSGLPPVARASSLAAPPPRTRTAYPVPAGPAGPPARVDILAVGASTGGPNAIAEIFAAIPASLPVPVVIVQHMPPVFTKLFAERLASSCPLAFREATGGEVLLPGHAYIAPGDHHLRVVREAGGVRLALDQGPPESSCRPAVDVLFRSVVELFGAGTLAVVLTGMGQDGLRGCERVRSARGQIVAQDEQSSVVWGMPGFVARAGLADAVVPLSQVAAEIVTRVHRARGAAGRAGTGDGRRVG